MVTDPTQMALFILVGVVLSLLFLIFVGPKVTPYSRRQWTLLMATLFVLYMPMGWYIIFVVGPSKVVDPRHVARVGALNLTICVPLLIWIGRRILKVGK
jgi:hypothetical protein